MLLVLQHKNEKRSENTVVLYLLQKRVLRAAGGAYTSNIFRSDSSIPNGKPQGMFMVYPV
jgi:hypothetical protein